MTIDNDDGEGSPADKKLNGGLVARNIAVTGRRTSVRLEPEMWQALKDIARREKCTIHAICSLVAMRKRPLSTLTAAIRVFVMLYYRAAATEDGHARAGHGDLGAMMERARVREADGIAPVRMPLTAPQWGDLAPQTITRLGRRYGRVYEWVRRGYIWIPIPSSSF